MVGPDRQAGDGAAHPPQRGAEDVHAVDARPARDHDRDECPSRGSARRAARARGRRASSNRRGPSGCGPRRAPRRPPPARRAGRGPPRRPRRPAGRPSAAPASRSGRSAATRQVERQRRIRISVRAMARMVAGPAGCINRIEGCARAAPHRRGGRQPSDGECQRMAAARRPDHGSTSSPTRRRGRTASRGPANRRGRRSARPIADDDGAASSASRLDARAVATRGLG